MKKDHIVVHHSAGKDGEGNDTASIREYHIENRGFRNIGYHAIIEKIGPSYEILIGRDWDKDGAHAIGHNRTGFGVCLVGDFTNAPPPPEQLARAAECIRLAKRLFGIKKNPIRIFAHCELTDTDCPGRSFPWVAFQRLIEEED